MKSAAIVTGLLLLIAAQTVVMADDTTTVRNGGDNATITQSGNPADTRKSVQRSPGHTQIEQRNGGNSGTIVQDSNPRASAPGDDDDEDDDIMPAPKPRADAGPGLDVYGVVRNQASPQGRANLDRLMNTLGIAR